jgi:GntR family transcriptional regulator
VWQVIRLRLIDGQPLVIEQALVPGALAPDLGTWRDDLQESLYGLLARRYGLADDHEEQYLEVHPAGARERRLLGLSAKARVIRLRGVSFTAADTPFDCFEQVYPAEEFAFYVSGQTARRLFRPADLRDWGVAASGKESA